MFYWIKLCSNSLSLLCLIGIGSLMDGVRRFGDVDCGVVGGVVTVRLCATMEFVASSMVFLTTELLEALLWCSR